MEKQRSVGLGSAGLARKALRIKLLPRLYVAICIGITPSLTLGLAPNAQASVDYFDLGPEQLLSAEVLSVSKKIEPLAEAPAAIYVVTSEDIERSGITTIPDALRMVPGVFVARSDSNTWAISIRGFNSPLANKLLVLIDGRTIYNPVYGGVLWEAHDLMLEDIERIEVVRGPGGALWGANAVNGIINIITKHTRVTQGNLASAIRGDEERATLSIRHGGSLNAGSSYRVYAKGFKRDQSMTPEGDDAYDEWDGFRSGFRVDANESFTVQGDVYRTDTQQRITQFSLLAPYTSVENQNIKYEGANLLGRWTDSRADGALLSIQSYVDWTKRDEPFNFVDERTTYDVEVQYNLAPSALQEIIVGAGYRYLSDDKQGNANVSFSPESRRDNIYSAFLQDKITLQDNWFLTLGSKFEHNQLSGFEFQPNVRLHWQAGQNQSFWAAISRAVRTPTPIEEDLTKTIATVENFRAAFVPNDDFKSEKLIAYELGYKQQITEDFSLDISTFYNDYDQLTTFTFQPIELVINDVDPPHILIPVKFTNDMTGTAQGIEASINWRLHHNLKLAADYSYHQLALDATDAEQEDAEDLHPRHQAGIRLLWNINQKWTWDTSARYVDKLTLGDIKDYLRLDINIGAQISKNIRFNLVGQNLIEKSHQELGGLDGLNVSEVERSVHGKLTCTF